MNSMETIRERLAEYAHKQWSGWMEYLFSKCSIKNNGTAIIPKWAVDRWVRQIDTEYKNLPESEKDSDRKEADGMLAALDSLEQEPSGEALETAARDYSTPGPWRLEGDEIVGRDGYRIAKMIAWEDAGKCLEGQHNLRRILAASTPAHITADRAATEKRVREEIFNKVRDYTDSEPILTAILGHIEPRKEKGHGR